MILKFWDTLNYFVFLYPLYMGFVWMIGGLIFFFRRERHPVPKPEKYNMFSIVVAAHNEEQEISRTLRRLALLEYPNYEVIVVNDGSTDKTADILDQLVSRYPDMLRVVHQKPNSGKAHAVNAGILFSRGEYILMIDADCYLDPHTLSRMAWHFETSPRVGAVTGNPRVINRSTLLAKIQIGEYFSIIGLIKRSQRILGKVLTVSGVIAAFRRSALHDCGFIDVDSVTEDIDTTWKLQRRFWDIRYEPQALCWIFVPETIRGLWRQRVRWAQGGGEVLKKHWRILLSWRQRRFWPIFFESVVDICWALSLSFLLVLWGSSYLIDLFFHASFYIQPLIPPAWTGSILALVCLMQFLVSMFIDSHYEQSGWLRHYFWLIWYPIFYWMLSAGAALAGFTNVFIHKRGSVKITWISPDRGIHQKKS